MDALLRGSTFIDPGVIDYEESLDLTAPLQCLAPITAALMAGFKMGATDGGKVGNFEHGYVGPGHPRDFKAAKRHQLRRFIAFRWRPGHRMVMGNPMRIEQFLIEFKTDASLRRHFESDPKWNDNLAIIHAKIMACMDSFGVKAGYDERRTLLIPMRGGDEALKRELLRIYEG